MNPKDYSANSPGELIRIQSRTGALAWSFLPRPLPPHMSIDSALALSAESAALALGRLDQLGRMLTNPMLLIQPFVSKEALASSRIEGTRADFNQLIRVEASVDAIPPDPDTQEVLNYAETLYAGWRQPVERPISIGLILELHQLLMQGVRGSEKEPGRLRSTQVMIGKPSDDLTSARYVPPPPNEIRHLLGDACNYLRAESPLPALVRFALFHYQFEAIHPFLDGNGRLGRLLMPLILRSWRMLDQPILYLSEYFERHREAYIDLLYAVSANGAWTDWANFVIKAIEEQSLDAVGRGHRLLELREQLRTTYQGTRRTRILFIIDRLFERPTITIAEAAVATGMTVPSANTMLKALIADNVLVEMTGRRRNQVFLAPQIYEAILGEPYEPRT